jgi:hypothetical protein
VHEFTQRRTLRPFARAAIADAALSRCRGVDRMSLQHFHQSSRSNGSTLPDLKGFFAAVAQISALGLQVIPANT